MTEVTGGPRVVAVLVGLVVAGFGGYLLVGPYDIPWWGSVLIGMVGLAIALPNRMLAIWNATKDKLPGGSGGGDR